MCTLSSSPAQGGFGRVGRRGCDKSMVGQGRTDEGVDRNDETAYHYRCCRRQQARERMPLHGACGSRRACACSGVCEGGNEKKAAFNNLHVGTGRLPSLAPLALDALL